MNARDRYLKDLDAAEASVGLAKELDTGAQVRQRHYQVILDGLAALRNNISLGAEPWL